MKKLKSSIIAGKYWDRIDYFHRGSMCRASADQLANRPFGVSDSMIRLELSFQLRENLSGAIWRALDSQKIKIKNN